MRCFNFCPQKENGGIVMVTFYNYFVTCGETARVADVAGKRLHGAAQREGRPRPSADIRGKRFDRL